MKIVVADVVGERRGGGVWPWAALLLVAGVLAMHGLVSTEHAVHRVPGPTSMPAGAAASALTSQAGAHSDGDAAPAGLAPSALLDLRDVGVGAVGLCLAVLLGGLLLRRDDRGWSLTGPVRPATTPRVRTSPPGRGPPRLLLAQLCVLRT